MTRQPVQKEAAADKFDLYPQLYRECKDGAPDMHEPTAEEKKRIDSQHVPAQDGDQDKPNSVDVHPHLWKEYVDKRSAAEDAKKSEQ